MSGQASTPVFEARPLLEDALTLLRELPPDVDEREDTLHAATVTLALANALTGAWGAARLRLHQARAMTPSTKRWKGLELFTAGTLEHRAMSRLQYIRAAAERAPKWQVAQFRLVREMEMLWRRRESFERDVALEIVECYRSLNPGIIAGWESGAYMHWLLGEPSDLDMAEVLLERGRQYSAIQKDTFVSDIDYGLARVAARRARSPPHTGTTSTQSRRASRPASTVTTREARRTTRRRSVPGSSTGSASIGTRPSARSRST